jgi:hypothetical protein
MPTYELIDIEDSFKLAIAIKANEIDPHCDCINAFILETAEQVTAYKNLKKLTAFAEIPF